MSAGVNQAACPICGNIPYDHERRVLVNGRKRTSYCSQACLRVGVRTTQLAQRKARLRRWGYLLTFVLAFAIGGYGRHLLRTWRPKRVPVAAQAPAPPPAPPEPTPFGPHWPPTDEEWLAELKQAAWIYPSPGPARRAPTSSRRLFADPAANAHCRTDGRCGVDLDGDLWGEHVYAAHDGVIVKVQRNDDEAYVRIAHWGGVVFTHYVHLAAVPVRLAAGQHVAAGDVIGLAGDGARSDAHEHLHFALSIRPSSTSPEVYWGPAPLMSDWPLRTPARGSVAGLVVVDAPPEPIAGAPSPHRGPARAKTR